MLMKNFGLVHGLIGALVGVGIFSAAGWRLRQSDEYARVRDAKAEVAEFQDRVREFIDKTGRQPGHLQELIQAYGLSGKVSTEDPWSETYGEPQHYQLMSKRDHEHRIVVCVMSLGADGMPGGDGFGEDIIAAP